MGRYVPRGPEIVGILESPMTNLEYGPGYEWDFKGYHFTEDSQKYFVLHTCFASVSGYIKFTGAMFE